MILSFRCRDSILFTNMSAAAGSFNWRRGKNRRACQPCSLRKVRCDRTFVRPCSNCVRRGKAEFCDLGPASHSRAQPHRAGEQATASTLSVSFTSVTPTVGRRESGILTAQAHDEDFLHTPAGNVATDAAEQPLEPEAMQSGRLSGRDEGSHNQYETIFSDHVAPTPSHVGEPSMATFIRHQARNTDVPLSGSLSSMLGLESRGGGYPFLDVGIV